MKLKLLDIMNSKDILEKLNSGTFSAKVSYIIQKNIKNINAELSNIEDTRKKMFEKYGQAQEDGTIKIMEENIDTYAKEMNDLMFQEIDIEIIQISLDEFDSLLSPVDMGRVDWMFKLE